MTNSATVHANSATAHTTTHTAHAPTHHHSGGSRVDTHLLLLVLFAILLPPLAVFLKRKCGVELVLSILLTICFWFPGMLYALAIVFDMI